MRSPRPKVGNIRASGVVLARVHADIFALHALNSPVKRDPAEHDQPSQLFQDVAHDETWCLLLLEFKLYAIRHPESKERFLDMYRRVRGPYDEATYAKILGAATKGRHGIGRAVAVEALEPLLAGFVVQVKFTPAILFRDAVHEITDRIFDFVPANF